MQELITRYALLLSLGLMAPALFAKGDATDALLRVAAVEAIDTSKQDQKLRAADHAKVVAVVETTILQLFDFDHITRLAVARNWRQATPEQQRVLTEQFKTLLVRIYSNSLMHYRGQIIDFEQLRTAPLGTELTVRSDARQAGKERTALAYEMEKTPAGWKIYGVKIGGLCLVSAYREVFAEKVRIGGVDGLIKFLMDANREGNSKSSSTQFTVLEKSWITYAILQNMLRSGLR
jgi:phospholipid transport system substrate-binding protein